MHKKKKILEKLEMNHNNKALTQFNEFVSGPINDINYRGGEDYQL